jgi:hypothetical protein
MNFTVQTFYFQGEKIPVSIEYKAGWITDISVSLGENISVKIFRLD